MRTQEEKNQVIEALKAQKLNLPEYSMFGVPNHQRADAQIQVIEQNMDDEEITKEWGEEYDEEGILNDIAVGAMEIYNCQDELKKNLKT
ncbi:hypothetical protein [Tenacibaculum maritimum]|uniref:hypothetical protein n=1 Tax=Tenacibaculum maritimum TaxID=107401 RepID=UPI0012E42CC3|nr:hypothetical protein [Tenacibaculum maritimum]CAA0152418.1 conserved hypothetical protein [Tenacibaculum maritimum]